MEGLSPEVQTVWTKEINCVTDKIHSKKHELLNKPMLSIIAAGEGGRTDFQIAGRVKIQAHAKSGNNTQYSHEIQP